MPVASPQLLSIAPGRVRPYDMLDPKFGMDCDDLGGLARLGIGFRGRTLSDMTRYAQDSMQLAGDSIQGLISTASINTPVQFLQNWLPGFVETITSARRIDDAIGISTIGAWSDEEIVQGLLEVTGTSVPYGDYTNVPLSSWNVNFVTRTVVRFEEGLKVGVLEEDRASRMRVNSGQSKREGAGLALEIQRNAIGFNGYNGGANATYGLLNDPGLSNYVTVAATGTGSSTLWSTKNFLQIVADLRAAIVLLRTQSQDNIDPKKLALTLLIATDAVDYLSVTSDFGYSVQEWLDETYPKIRVVSAPELNTANAGAGVFYLYADAVDDTSTDDKRTWIQVVPQRFMVVGVAKLAKGYEEDYSNATAGVMLKRPYAVVRFTGIS